MNIEPSTDLFSNKLAKFNKKLQHLGTVNNLSIMQQPSGAEVRILGVFTTVKRGTNQNGNKWAFAVLQDNYGSIELAIAPKSYPAVANALRVGTAVLVRGALDVGNTMRVIDVVEITKLKDL